jgi:hypothetical protein
VFAVTHFVDAVVLAATALPDDPVRAVVFLVGALNELSGSW